MTNKCRVIYSPEAVDDIKSIYRYIAYDIKSVRNAEAQINRIRSKISKLDLFPKKFVQVEWEPWASMGLHQMPVDNYLVYYLIKEREQLVIIVRIFYNGQNIELIINEEKED